MGAALLILLILPLVDNSKVLSCEYYPFSEFAFFNFIGVTFLLGWLGMQAIESPFVEFAQKLTAGMILSHFFKVHGTCHLSVIQSQMFRDL